MASEVIGVVLLCGMTMAMPLSIAWTLGNGPLCDSHDAAVGPKRVGLRSCPPDPCEETEEVLDQYDPLNGTWTRKTVPVHEYLTRCNPPLQGAPGEGEGGACVNACTPPPCTTCQAPLGGGR